MTQIQLTAGYLMQIKSLFAKLGPLLVIFLAINILIYFIYSNVEKNPVADKYGLSSLEKVYPGKNRDQIYKLLVENWMRPYLYEPFTQFKERPYRGDYVNVDENGFRFSADQVAWPPSPENLNIFVFGGSTTFGYGVADRETVPSHLQEKLRERLGSHVAVYNFGRGYYYSTQERVLFEQLLLSGHAPNIAIFIDGLNDFYQDVDEPFLTPRLREIMDAPPATAFAKATEMAKELGRRAIDLPIVRAVKDAAAWLICSEKCEKADSATPDASADLGFSDPDALKKRIERYLANKKLIEAVAGAYHVEPVFVWQPVPTFKYDQKSHLFAPSDYGKNKYSLHGYKAMQELVARTPLGANFLWCADIQEGVNEALYVDAVHYTASFSETVASCISGLLDDRHLFDDLAFSPSRP